MVKPSRDEEEEKAARKRLPARSSRGTRIRQLVGEEADADASFWSQDAWREDEEDADYSTEEGGGMRMGMTTTHTALVVS